MTWPEVEEHLNINQSLLIPVGTCEQHGKHLPLNHDTLVAEYFAEYLSSETNILIAPTLNYGVNLPGDRYFAGTTGLTDTVLRDTVAAIMDWWKIQGFNKFVLISYHADPFHIEALKSLASRDKNILLLKPGEIEYGHILDKQTAIKHACEAETSLALYLYPQKVRLEKIEEFDIPFEVFEEYLKHTRDDQIPGYVGCLGFPSAATAEKGERIVSSMKQRALKLVKEFVG